MHSGYILEKKSGILKYSCHDPEVSNLFSCSVLLVHLKSQGVESCTAGGCSRVPFLTLNMSVF